MPNINLTYPIRICNKILPRRAYRIIVYRVNYYLYEKIYMENKEVNKKAPSNTVTEKVSSPAMQWPSNKLFIVVLCITAVFSLLACAATILSYMQDRQRDSGIARQEWVMIREQMALLQYKDETITHQKAVIDSFKKICDSLPPAGKMYITPERY